jgi:hypothetical protein
VTVAENPSTESLFAEEKAYSSPIPPSLLVANGHCAANPELKKEARTIRTAQKRLAWQCISVMGILFNFRLSQQRFVEIEIMRRHGEDCDEIDDKLPSSSAAASRRQVFHVELPST